MNLDAYTVRKLAPKLLIAVVAVNISIYLCVAAIDITNVAGRGINQLITAPFHQAAQDKFQLDTLQGPDDSLVFFGITIAVGLLLTFSLAGGQLLPMIALTMFPIILAVLAMLVTLVIRKALLVILTIVSPIAFALWVLPGTDKYFKQWWSLFLKTLMVYPIVAALFAVTNIMAVVTFNSGQVSREEVVAAGEIDPGQAGGVGADAVGENALNAIIGIILVFIPLFMIPFAFKFAGGAIGAISGQLSDLQKPFSRMAGRSRQKRLESNFKSGMEGGLFNTGKKGRRDRPGREGYFRSRELGKGRAKSALSGLKRATTRPNLADVNRGIAKATAVPAVGFNPKKWRKRLTNRRAQTAFAGVAKAMEDPDFAAFRGEETIAQAIQEGTDEKDVLDRFRTHTKWTPGEQNNRFFDAKGNLTGVGNELFTSGMKFREHYGADTAGMAAFVAQASTSPGWGNTEKEYLEGDLGTAKTATRQFLDAAVDASGGHGGVAVQLAQLAQKEAPGKVDQTGGSGTALGEALYTGASLGKDAEQYADTVAAYTLSLASHGGAGAWAQAKPKSFDNGMALLTRIAKNAGGEGPEIRKGATWEKLTKAEKDLSTPVSVARMMHRLQTNNNYATEVNARGLGKTLNAPIHNFDTGTEVLPNQSYTEILSSFSRGYAEKEVRVAGPAIEGGEPPTTKVRVPISKEKIQEFEGGIYSFGRSALDQEYQMHAQQEREAEARRSQGGG